MSGSSSYLGVFPLIVMVLLYAFEHRSRMSLLVFALACSAAALSDFLAGRWLFGIVAVGFSLAALRRWKLRPVQNDNASCERIRD